MILKNFEINKININKHKNFLFYGNNEGFINEVINEKFIKDFQNNIYKYDENDVLNNKDNFFNQALNSSFFDNKKLIIVSRATNKITEIIEEIIEKRISDITLILISSQLDKKSKLRNFFEKNKETVCVAFYPDTEITLSRIALEFFKKNNITISQQNINFIIAKCNNDRKYLLNELKKIELLALNKKNLSIDDIMKIVNLTENHSINELINCCLLMNKKKMISILNENNFNVEDTILILRTFLSKLKKILKLANVYKTNQNLDETIKTARPPIFWKEKDDVKKQLISWTPDKIESLIYELNKIELQVKTYSKNSINIMMDFILSRFSKNTNNWS